MKRFKLIVYAIAIAIAATVVLSSCGVSDAEKYRIERAVIAKLNAKNDSINALPIKVYCGMVEGFCKDSVLFCTTIYDRDSMNLEIKLAEESRNLQRYAVDVDSVADNRWQLIVN